MKKTIIIENDQSIIDITATCNVVLVFEKKHCVEIKPYTANRTLLQNALYWRWLTILGNELGESKEDVAETYKGMFLVNIMRRDDLEFSEMLKSVNEVHLAGLKDQALQLKKEIIKLTSTTKINTKQMTEYLNNINHHAATVLGITLPLPEDRGLLR